MIRRETHTRTLISIYFRNKVWDGYNVGAFNVQSRTPRGSFSLFDLTCKMSRHPKSFRLRENSRTPSAGCQLALLLSRLAIMERVTLAAFAAYLLFNVFALYKYGGAAEEAGERDRG